jgi:PKD repeat protein
MSIRLQKWNNRFYGLRKIEVGNFMKINRKIGLVILLSIVLLSATALAATPLTKTEPVLKANFTATFNQKAPLNVTFLDKSTGSPTKWSWNFGDKTKTVTTKNAKHTYKKAGKYTVTLTVKDAKKHTDKRSKVIIVKKKM